MLIPATQRSLDCLDQNDAFLHACLGLLSVFPRFDRLLAEVATRSPAPSPQDAAARELVQVALGAIAVRPHLAALLERIGAASPRPRDSRTEPDPDAFGGLLR